MKKNIRNWRVSEKLLNWKASNKYEEQKWIKFCRELLDLGYHVRLTESRSTNSKYIRIYFDFEKSQYFEVRFSDHLPNKSAEDNYNSDFYVGHSNNGVTNYKDAIRSSKLWMESIRKENIDLFCSWRSKSNDFFLKINKTVSSTEKEKEMANLILKIRNHKLPQDK